MLPFFPPLTSQCCLCGSSQALSGEHKIKASALRAIFGKQGMVIGRAGEAYRHAQSPNSKAFHFSARVCEVCNNARTQPADLAFDKFNAQAFSLLKRGLDPAEVHNDPRFSSSGGPLYLNVFRYFAKLMCCHLAEMGAPFYVQIADFAIGISDTNFILLHVDLDVTYKRIQARLTSASYAAHGGLIITGDELSHAPTSFYSTLTIGPVRYCYQIRFNELGQLLLRIEHPAFYDWCKRKIRDAIDNPISDEDRETLGLAPKTPNKQGGV
ncbi:hypothetical protein CHR62_11935 [Pusillimonas sp. NJUB218]|nr:hypothetical protein CHR62_11935 [Pusillimonas sp. NJUB218]